MSTVDIPVSEAIGLVTGWDIIEAEKRFGRPMEEMGATRATWIAIWSSEQRRTGAKPNWDNIIGMTMAGLNDYFAPEPEVPDELAEDDEAGKGEQLMLPLDGWPVGASPPDNRQPSGVS